MMDDFEVFITRICPCEYRAGSYDAAENCGVHYLLDASASHLKREDFSHIIERCHAYALALLQPSLSEPSNELSYRAPRLPP